MKKFIICLAAVLGFLSTTGCSDMLDVKSDSQVFDPSLNQKTDSVFFSLGIMQAMQQLADQYVFQGEMRGDNVKLTAYTNNNLRTLANFSADATNRYDSAYVYYRVINNCNYYIAHRDTMLYTGSTNVVRNEFAAVKAFRAWAYLQLARNYGKVPFFTEPLTTISQINGSHFPSLTLKEIVARLAPDLQQYSGCSVPNDGNATIAAGSTNSGQAKTVSRALCFIPVDVILGEMYLEAGDYANAAKYYTVFLTQTPHPSVTNGNLARGYSEDMQFDFEHKIRPTDWKFGARGASSWSSIFDNNSTADIVSYIPMAVNYQMGTTTNIPLAFGYNYYSTEGRNNMYIDKIQIKPSAQLQTLSDTATYYYEQDRTGALAGEFVNGVKYGDQRLQAVTHETVQGDSTVRWITKYNNGNIILYRTTTIYMHLAEALNRLGHPDLAFAILKDGINQSLTDPTYTYVTPESKTLLTTTYPFLGSQFSEMFPRHTSGTASVNTNYGIHMHGCGYVADDAYPDRPGSPMCYNYSTELSNKLAYLRKEFPAAEIGTTKADSINAMEDILCDEYQLEFAFEGTRWYDLMRLARHKNQAGMYGGNFGGQWLARKLQYKHPVKDLTHEENWYLPMK